MVALPKWVIEYHSKTKTLQQLDNPQTMGEHLKRNRVVLGLLQKDVADIIGVSEDTITNWENGRFEPQKRYYQRIIEFLGYSPCFNAKEY